MESVGCKCPICGLSLRGDSSMCCDRVCPYCGHVLVPAFDLEEYLGCGLEE